MRRACAVVLGITLGLVAAVVALTSTSIGGSSPVAALVIGQSLATSGEPSSIAIDALAGRAYVTDAKENTLYVFDLSSGLPVAFVPTGRQPMQVALAGGRAYVSNFADSTITVVDTATARGTKTLALAGLGLAADAAAGRLYVAAGARIVVLDTRTDSVARPTRSATRRATATTKPATRPR